MDLEAVDIDGDLTDCSKLRIRQDLVCDSNLKGWMVVVYFTVLAHSVAAVAHEVVEVAIKRAEVRVAHGPARSSLGGENHRPCETVP